MKMMKMFGFTAAAVLCLGLAQAGADGGAVNEAQPTTAGQETTAIAMASFTSEAGVAMTTSSSVPQMEGVSADFLQAIGQAAAHDHGPINGIICVDSGNRVCCYDWLVGWICAPIEG